MAVHKHLQFKVYNGSFIWNASIENIVKNLNSSLFAHKLSFSSGRPKNLVLVVYAILKKTSNLFCVLKK